MQKKWRVLYLALSILLMLFALNLENVQASEGGLFADAQMTANLNLKKREGNADPSIIRSRHVTIDFNNLVNKDAFEGKGIVVLNLFTDLALRAVKNRFERRGTESYSWFGTIEGVNESMVILAVEDGKIAGNITIGNQMYHIRDIGNGTHSVREIDPSAFPDELPPTPITQLPGDLTVPEGAMLDDGSIIDIMVVYTTAAAVGGSIASEIQLAIDETNQSYINSGVNPRMRLVKTVEVSYAESGNIQIDRNRLQNKTDGYMDNVHALRDLYGADMVALIVANGGGYCGMAYIMTSVSTSFENYAFQVTARSCATGYYSFGHEFGHIQSARHDWYVDSTNNSPYTYNHGYVDPRDNWRTIMAYRNDCGSCSRIQYWSNPDVLYGGQPMGVHEGQFNAADNRKTLNNTAWTVANFRQSISADVNANNSDGPVTLSQGAPLSVTVSLNAGGGTANADWWVVADTPAGWYRYDGAGGTWVPGTAVTRQGPLLDLSSYEVFNMSGLPLGGYIFYFGVDMVMNGSVDQDQLIYDSVMVNIQ